MKHLKYSTCLKSFASMLAALTIAVLVRIGESLELGNIVGEASDFPSLAPSVFPSLAPSDFPSLGPSAQPSDSPSSAPIDLPSRLPTSAPSGVPNSWTSSAIHSNIPRTDSEAQTDSVPSDYPSLIPPDWAISVPPSNDNVAVFPSYKTSDYPSLAPHSWTTKPETPSIAPSSLPSDVPTSGLSSSVQSDYPSLVPHSWAVSFLPSNVPSSLSRDSVYPSSVPTEFPKSDTVPTGESPFALIGYPVYPSLESFSAQGDTLSSAPSYVGSHNLTPSDVPSSIPSLAPSGARSFTPSDTPSWMPSSVPSGYPRSSPSSTPSLAPSDMPSTTPSSRPTDVPTLTPSQVPSRPPSAVPSDLPSLPPSDAPSTFPSTKPSSTPSNSPSTMISTVPSDIPSSLPSTLPSDVPSLVPSASPTDFNVDDSRDQVDNISDGEPTRGASSGVRNMKLWKTVGASATVGSLLAILVALLAVQRMRRNRRPRRELPTIVLQHNGASGDPYGGFLQGSSEVQGNSTTSFALSSMLTKRTVNSDMLPAKQLGIPSEVMDSMFDDVNSEMSPSSPPAISFGDNDTFRNIPDESGYCCGDLATNSEDAYVDALEDPSFGETEKVLSDLIALEKDRSVESQNSSLRGLPFVVSSHSKEVTNEAKQEHSIVKSKGKKDSPYQQDELNNDVDQRQRVVNHMSEMELATPSNMMTPKRSNRSNNGTSNESARRFFRNSGSPRSEGL